MLIQIDSGKPEDKRSVTVTDEGMEPLIFTAANLSEAHKMLKQGRKDGWDTLRPKKAK